MGAVEVAFIHRVTGPKVEERVVTTDANRMSPERRATIDAQRAVHPPGIIKQHPLDVAIQAAEAEVDERLAAVEEARRVVELAGDEAGINELIREKAKLQSDRDHLVHELTTNAEQLTADLLKRQDAIVRAQDKVGKARTEARDVRLELHRVRQEAASSASMSRPSRPSTCGTTRSSTRRAAAPSSSIR
jgi:chromosome segregation ATPase